MMRNEFLEVLKNETSIILGKENYYRERLRQRRDYIEENRKKALSSGVLPYVFDHYLPKIPGVKTVFFSAIIEIHGDTAYYSNFHYLEEENPGVTWMVTEMDVGNSYFPYYILFTEHYMERYSERNPAWKRYTGNIKEAMILDVLGGAGSYKTGLSSKLIGQFIDPSEFMNLDLPERMRWLENLKNIAGVSDKMFEAYLNMNENISITKTGDGYGVYRIDKETRVIDMITWLSGGMLTEEQKSLFYTLTQEVLKHRSRG